MGPLRFRLSVLFLLTGAVGFPVAARSQTAPRHPWHAAAGVTFLNVVPWTYNWYVQRWPWSRIGFQSWKENLRAGFQWDDNSFSDNQLAHPYHGSLYFHSARASGYGFWGSLPYVATGSAAWELFFENARPSLNDFINTTLGGMALGEVTFRLSSLLRLGVGEGAGLFARRAGAFALSPIGTTQGLLHGTLAEDNQLREDDQAWIALGRRSGRPYLTASYQYGSPFSNQAVKPYDVFEFSLQLGPSPHAVVREVAVSGLLARHQVGPASRDQVVLGLYQHYDYEDVPGIRIGSQSLSGAVLYQRRLSAGTQLRVHTHLETVLLGAVSSDEAHVWKRDYDYGSGAGARVMTAIRHDGRDFVRFDARVIWVHSWYGARAEHLASSWRLGTAIRLGHLFALGGDVGAVGRRSWYPDRSAVQRQVGETRAYLIWPTQ
jgi:hypothetical protein